MKNQITNGFQKKKLNYFSCIEWRRTKLIKFDETKMMAHVYWNQKEQSFGLNDFFFFKNNVQL